MCVNLVKEYVYIAHVRMGSNVSGVRRMLWSGGLGRRGEDALIPPLCTCVYFCIWLRAFLCRNAGYLIP